MGTVYLDLIDDLTCEEEGGAIVSLKRKVIVDGLTTRGIGVLLEALETPGVPAYGSEPQGYPNLRCVKRTPKVMREDPKKVEIALEYVRVQNDFWSVNPFEFRVTGGTSLQQTETEFDASGAQITVSHTFPADDDDWPNETRTQGGIASVLSPRTTYRFEGVIETAYPDIVSRIWTGALNLTPWANSLAGTWLCTDVQFELLTVMGSVSTLGLLPRYRFTFEFLFKADGHQPAVRFNDPRDNQPPPNLVAGVGYGTINWHPYLDFNQLLPLV